MEYGQREGSCFAGAGLGASEHVAAIEDWRDRLFLDGGWRVVAFFGDGVEEWLREVKGREMGQQSLLRIARQARRDEWFGLPRPKFEWNKYGLPGEHPAEYAAGAASRFPCRPATLLRREERLGPPAMRA